MSSSSSEDDDGNLELLKEAVDPTFSNVYKPKKRNYVPMSFFFNFYLLCFIYRKEITNNRRRIKIPAKNTRRR